MVWHARFELTLFDTYSSFADAERLHFVDPSDPVLIRESKR